MPLDLLEQIISNPKLRTPSFVCLEGRLLDNCRGFRRIADAVRARALYSLKALTLPQLLPLMAEVLHGFSTSSLFEAQLARDFGGKDTEVHLTCPALRLEELQPLSVVCDFVNLNSLAQLTRYGPALGPRVQLGLRINPEISFVSDPRYDPCMPFSRLGVTFDRAQEFIERNPQAASKIRGLHFHTNCESDDFGQLCETVTRITPLLAQLNGNIASVNLGGGYYFPESGVPQKLRAAIGQLRAVNPDLEIYLEPGTALAQDAGALVATVLDIIEQSPIPIAVLDTSINHLPELFEYRYTPEIYGANDMGAYGYRLTGRSCLAGDVFGECRFDRPIELGSRICFMNVGSYSLVKANMFNGIPTPYICTIKADGTQVLQNEATYEKWVRSYLE